MHNIDTVTVIKASDAGDLHIEEAALTVIAGSASPELMRRCSPLGDPYRPEPITVVALPEDDDALWWAFAYRAANLAAERRSVVIVSDGDRRAATRFVAAVAKLRGATEGEITSLLQSRNLPGLADADREYVTQGPPELPEEPSDTDEPLSIILTRAKEADEQVTEGERWLEAEEGRFEDLETRRGMAPSLQFHGVSMLIDPYSPSWCETSDAQKLEALRLIAQSLPEDEGTVYPESSACADWDMAVKTFVVLRLGSYEGCLVAGSLLLEVVLYGAKRLPRNHAETAELSAQVHSLRNAGRLEEVRIAAEREGVRLLSSAELDSLSEEWDESSLDQRLATAGAIVQSSVDLLSAVFYYWERSMDHTLALNNPAGTLISLATCAAVQS